MVEPVRRRGPYRAGVQRRQQIVEAATAAFGRHGYAGASLKVIADVVGVSVPGLLKHYGSKEELLTAVLDQWDAEASSLTTSNAEGLEWFLQIPDVMGYHEAHPGLIELYLTLCGEASDPHHPARAWVAQRYDRIVREGMHHLTVARARGEIRPMTDQELEREVRGLYGLMDGLELHWINSPHLGLVDIFEPIFRVMVDRWRDGAVRAMRVKPPARADGAAPQSRTGNSRAGR